MKKRRVSTIVTKCIMLLSFGITLILSVIFIRNNTIFLVRDDGDGKKIVSNRQKNMYVHGLISKESIETSCNSQELKKKATKSLYEATLKNWVESSKCYASPSMPYDNVSMTQYFEREIKRYHYYRSDDRVYVFQDRAGNTMSLLQLWNVSKQGACFNTQMSDPKINSIYTACGQSKYLLLFCKNDDYAVKCGCDIRILF